MSDKNYNSRYQNYSFISVTIIIFLIMTFETVQ